MFFYPHEHYNIVINPVHAMLSYLNFHSLKVVFRDVQVGENYTYLYNLRPFCKYWDIFILSVPTQWIDRPKK